MKKILFSLFIILILTSCSKQKKDAALENCADRNFLNNYERENIISTNYAGSIIYLNLVKQGKFLSTELYKIIEEKKKIETKYKKNNPKPLLNLSDKPEKRKLPLPAIATDISKKLKSERDIKQKIFEEHEKNDAIWWKNFFLTTQSLTSKIKDYQKSIKENRIFRINTKLSFADKKFKLMKLKEKSKINLYLRHYTRCENEFNNTPSAFLLEWQNN